MALIVWRETPSTAARAPWDRPAAVRRLRTSLFMVTSMLVTMKGCQVDLTAPRTDPPCARGGRGWRGSADGTKVVGVESARRPCSDAEVATDTLMEWTSRGPKSAAVGGGSL